MSVITNVAFVVPGEPVAKGRARSTAAGRHYTPAKTVAYETLVSMVAQNAMGAAMPFPGPLAVEIEAVHTVPASWSQKRRNEALCGRAFPAKRPDLDNLVKALGDGANGIVWMDDCQIVVLHASKTYGERPEVRVRVAVL